MRTPGETGAETSLGDQDTRYAQASRRAADALLHEHADALVFAQTTDGQIVPMPASLGMDDYPVLASEGRTGVDLCVAEDRMTLVNAWIRLKAEAVAEARARLRSDPGQWQTVRMFDLRNTHGVVLCVVWPCGAPDDPAAAGAQQPVSTAPRFCSRRQDLEGNVLSCDEAYLQMFGYAHEDEVIGHPTFERVHPDDQARLIESWIAMVATARVQMARVRVRREDGDWLWVDTSYHNFLGHDGDGYVLAECIDVSGEMAAQEELQDREELLRRLLEEMPDGLLQLDDGREVVYHNPRLLEVLHGPAAARSASSASLEAILFGLEDQSREALDGALGRALEQGLSDDVEVRVMRGDGERRQILFKLRPLVRDTGRVTGAIASVHDVTDSARARQELERRAASDPLTGAHNRASILALLEHQLAGGEGAAVVYVDLDRFKAVNDTLGHAAGDEVLLAVSARAREAMRSGDELGRLGGDEFLILLRGATAQDTAMAAALRIGEALRGTYELASGSVELRASVGVALAADAVTTAEALVGMADAAMYRSKQQRRGEPVFAG
jgi:diguanylate cyclase (GGDEF)-like protein/PAS domain S-box-containing protein